MAQLLLDILHTFAIILLIGYSFRCIYSALRFFYMAHAVTLALGGYFVFEFVFRCGLPYWSSVILAVFGGILVMLIAYYLLYNMGLQDKIAGWKMMVVSLGLYIILENVISIHWGNTRLSIKTWEETVGYEVLGGFITKEQIISILVSFVLIAIVELFIKYTHVGKRLMAVSVNPEMSSVCGLSNSFARAVGVTIGSALMACAGILIGADVDLTPSMGFDWLLYGVIAMIIAGTGKGRFLLLGALLLATAQHLAALFLDNKWMNATAYVILIVFLYFRPYGFSRQGIKKTEV